VAEQKHLANAPIKEAVIEIRTIASDGFEIELFDSDQSDFELDGYSKKDVLKSQEFEIKLEDNDVKKQSVSAQLLGYRYCSDDQKHIVSFQKTAFTFSRLKPYENWDAFCGEAEKLWKIYIAKANPIKATRIATRFINIIDIPLPIRDFSDYLVSPPEIPDGLPQSISSYMSRIVFPNEDAKYFAIVTQSLERATEEFAPILLDIDVFLQEQVDIDGAIWEHLENLRVFKDRIFFKSLHEQTVELFT